MIDHACSHKSTSDFGFDSQCSFMEYKNYKVVYRKYASLYFIIAIDNSDVRMPAACGTNVIYLHAHAE